MFYPRNYSLSYPGQELYIVYRYIHGGSFSESCIISHVSAESNLYETALIHVTGAPELST